MLARRQKLGGNRLASFVVDVARQAGARTGQDRLDFLPVGHVEMKVIMRLEISRCFKVSLSIGIHSDTRSPTPDWLSDVVLQEKTAAASKAPPSECINYLRSFSSPERAIRCSDPESPGPALLRPDPQS